MKTKSFIAEAVRPNIEGQPDKLMCWLYDSMYVTNERFKKQYCVETEYIINDFTVKNSKHYYKKFDEAKEEYLRRKNLCRGLNNYHLHIVSEDE